MELIKLKGYCDGSTFIEFEIKGGNSQNSIGDQMWISGDGAQLLISDFASFEIIEETTQLFIPAHRKAFKGALRRVGVEVD